MERLPENKVLKYNPDTLVALRKVYNLDKPGQMDEAIDLLDSWVKKQGHFVRKEFPREYLERLIILLKGSVERAKAQLDKICTLRTLLPNFFEKCDAKNDYKLIKGFSYNVFLPKLTKDNTRILISKYESTKYTSKVFLHVYYYFVLIWINLEQLVQQHGTISINGGKYVGNIVSNCSNMLYKSPTPITEYPISEYLKAHDYSNGIATIIDIRDIHIMEFVSQLNLLEMKQICTIFLEGYDTRAQNFFFLSTSKTIDVLIKIFKQMISEKLGKRVHIFKEVEELHEYIPRDILPSDYGGYEKSVAELYDDQIEEFGTQDNIKYFKEMSKCCTIESLRTSTKFNEDFSGIAGTFRTLSVD